MAMKIAIVALSQGGLDLARRLQPELDGAVVHGLADRADGADVPFTDTMAHLRGLFAEGTAIIGVFAAGITIRALGPNLANKKTESPVIALAEDGSVAVPLLGGHRGANRLARQIAGILNGSAAITTAGDLELGLALDEPPRGWTVANPQVAKTLAAAMLAGDSVRLIVEAGDDPWPDRALFSESGDLTLLITDRAGREDDKTLVIHPPVLALGVGCERGASTGELQALVDETLAEAGLAPGALAAIASLDLKSDEEAVLAQAENLGLPARFFTAAELEAEAPRLANPSEVVFSEVGCHGVSEGAALALAGPDSELIVPKRKSARATCAVARSPETINTNAAGTARGRLAAQGKSVALVCSGDPGIYALATLVFELLDRGEHPHWNHIETTIVPGISALQAAAARAGAPLGHDFCAISLSDLLTPKETILKRLKAASEADFVVALYNPQSKTRRELLPLAKQILATARPPETPVILARNLARADETVIITTLAEFDTESVDMLTLVMIGNSQTRVTKSGRAYTPRGYEKKAQTRTDQTQR
jgi:cobalt-precorrin 5A hydrolase/precorrin-3B C17-methyltransferase